MTDERRFDGGDESRVQALMAENERMRMDIARLRASIVRQRVEIVDLREAIREHRAATIAIYREPTPNGTDARLWAALDV